MKTTNVIAEAKVGVSVELSITELIVLKSYTEMLYNKTVDNDGEKRRYVSIDTPIIDNVINFLNKICGEGVSLTEAEKIFEKEVKEEVKEEVTE
jgi:hypothetical protein